MGRGEAYRLLYDGAGLCSPGLWAPQDRFPASGPALEIQKELDQELDALGDSFRGGLNRLFDDLAAGHIHGDPFPVEATVRLRGVVRRASSGHELKLEGAEVLQVQPIDVLLLGSALKAMGDPDWKVMRTYAVGVPLGVGVELPRTPGGFSRLKRSGL